MTTVITININSDNNGVGDMLKIMNVAKNYLCRIPDAEVIIAYNREELISLQSLSLIHGLDLSDCNLIAGDICYTFSTRLWDYVEDEFDTKEFFKGLV